MSWYFADDISPLFDVDPTRVVCFDLETTGLNSRVDEILQIVILSGDSAVLLNEFVRPQKRSVWPSAQRIHGIGPCSVADKPNFNVIAPLVQGVFDNADMLVGYNISFDEKFLKAAGVRIAAPMRFDVMREFALSQSRGNVRAKWSPLSACAAHYGIAFESHDALEDAKATLECFHAIASEWKKDRVPRHRMR